MTHINPVAYLSADPVKRIIELCGYDGVEPVYHEVGEELIIEGQWRHLRCHKPNDISHHIIFNNDDSVDEGRVVHSGPGYFRYYDWTFGYTQEVNWAIVLEEYSDCDGRISKGVNQIHIWGDPDVEEIARQLSKWRFGFGDGDYLEARRFGRGDEWVLNQIEPGDDYTQVKILGETFMFDWLGGGGFQGITHVRGSHYWTSLAGVFNRFDWYPDEVTLESRLEYLPPEQREYVDALLDFEKAKKFIERFEFFVFEDRLYRLVSEDGRLSQVNDDYCPGGVVEQLFWLRIHGRNKLVDYAKNNLAQEVVIVGRIGNKGKTEGKIDVSGYDPKKGHCVTKYYSFFKDEEGEFFTEKDFHKILFKKAA